MFFVWAIVNSSNYVNLIKSRTYCIKQLHNYVGEYQLAVVVTSHAVLKFGFTCGISSCLLFVISTSCDCDYVPLLTSYN